MEWEVTNDFGGVDNVALEVKLKDWGYCAYIKWDGCCEIYKTINKGCPSEEIEQIHICDIPQYIKMLQSLEDFRMNNIDIAQ